MTGETSDRPRFAWLIPGPIDVAFLLILFSATVVRGWQAINTDGDLGRHLRVGETILERGSLFYEDLFSWTMAGQPFVPYEWLSEILFAISYRVAGFPGVIALTGFVVASSYLLLALLLKRHGIDPLLSFIVTIGAALSGAFHWLARPHVFTLAGVAALLWLLEGVPKDRDDVGEGAYTVQPADDRPLLMIVIGATFLLFAVWANLHGGFLFGLVTICLYAFGDVIATRTLRSSYILLLAAALAGTLINPVGPALLGHVAGYLGKTFLVDMTLEYRSPDFHGWIGRTFLAVFMCSVAMIGVSRRPLALSRLLVFLVTSAFALHSARNIPLWGLTGLAVVTLHYGPEWCRLQNVVLARARRAFASASAGATTGLWSLAAVCLLPVVTVSGGGVAGGQLLPAALDPDVFPVDAVETARRQGVQGRVFNELGWGGYLLHAWPEQKVFIDGQTDFYGEELSRRYVRIRAAEGSWQEELRQEGVELILLPPDAPLIQAAEELGWHALSRDPTAVLLARSGN